MVQVRMRARWRQGHRRVRGLGLAALTVLGVVALPAAAAQAAATWTGASTATPASPNWTDTGNWSPAPPAATTANGTLTFPTLTTCTSCYTSANNLSGTGFTADLAFTNTSGTYHILGPNSITLDSTGIVDNPGFATSTTINAPLVLSANQTWTIGAPFNSLGSNSTYNSVSLAPTAAVTGSPSTLSVTFPTGTGTAFGGDLFVDGNMEVGTVTVTGDGGLHVGGGGSNGSVNATDGNAVDITGKATLIPNPGATVGPLSLVGGNLLLGTGTGNTATTTLGVNGSGTVSFDANSAMSTLINDNGSTAGTDFSQLTASGNVALNGKLILNQNKSNGVCAALSRGDVATLITTTGALSGAFTNAPEGQVLTLGGACAGAQVQIHYTTNSVIATVVNGTTPTTTTLATPNPSPASTNQKVTLTATVTTNTNSTVAPAGTMAFTANGTTISGCGSQPITVSGSSAQATCATSFAGADSPRSLTATFTGASGSGQATSSSSAQNLTINKGTTKTKLDASNTSPSAGGSVTYTATVTPDVSGATSPSGKVAFMDGGNAISGCVAQPLNGGKATCTVTYANGGSHSITATYQGDSSFTGSTSSATTVTVAGTPPPPKKSTGKLLGPGGRLTVIGGRIRFAQKCQSKVLCRGTFLFTATVKGKHNKLTTVRCAGGSFRIKAGRAVTLRVKLSNACLRLLRATVHRQLAVLYTSKSSTGQVGQRKRIMLVLK